MSELQIWIAVVAVGLVAIVVSAAISPTASAPFWLVALGLIIWARWKGPSYASGDVGSDDGGGDGDGGGE